MHAAIRLAFDGERARLALADVLLDAGRVAEAQQVLKETVQEIPDSGAAHYGLGQLYQTLSLLPQAVQEYEKAVALDPLVGLDRLYETIGNLYVNQANFDRAVDAYAKRADVNPNNADAHRKLGEIYFLQGRNDEALAEFVGALLLDPKSSDALAGACQVYVRMGRYADAVDASRQALTLDTRHNEARYALATSLMRLGSTDEAKKELETFQRVQAETMANTRRQSELKVILRDAAAGLAKNEYVEAAALIRKALTIDPDNAGAQRDLGVALMKTTRYDEAILAFQKSLQLADTAEVHQLLADTYTSMGRLSDSQAQRALAARAVDRVKEERLRRLSAGR